MLNPEKFHLAGYHLHWKSVDLKHLLGTLISDMRSKSDILIGTPVKGAHFFSVEELYFDFRLLTARKKSLRRMMCQERRIKNSKALMVVAGKELVASE